MARIATSLTDLQTCRRADLGGIRMYDGARDLRQKLKSGGIQTSAAFATDIGFLGQHVSAWKGKGVSITVLRVSDVKSLLRLDPMLLTLKAD